MKFLVKIPIFWSLKFQFLKLITEKITRVKARRACRRKMKKSQFILLIKWIVRRWLGAMVPLVFYPSCTTKREQEDAEFPVFCLILAHKTQQHYSYSYVRALEFLSNRGRISGLPLIIFIAHSLKIICRFSQTGCIFLMTVACQL